MKCYFFLFRAIFVMSVLSCNNGGNLPEANNGKADTGDVTPLITQVEMIDSVYNFGKIKEGEKVVFSYRFKNNGNNPLVVSSTYASCGCTVPEKPEQPMAPGQSGYIKIVFNSKGTGGSIHKQVRVISNARPDFPLLTLTGEVMAN